MAEMWNEYRYRVRMGGMSHTDYMSEPPHLAPWFNHFGDMAGE